VELKKTRKFAIPAIPLIWTCVAACGFAAIHVNSEWINDRHGLGPGETNLVKYLLILSTGFVWLLWLAFFSRFPGRLLITLFILASIATFFYSFRLVMDGDLGFVRIVSRFEQREFGAAPPSTIESTIDLTKTSPRDFRQFLGNSRDAVINNCRIDTDWSANPPQLKWKQAIGEGWSGFVAVNGSAVTQEQRGNDECISCYDVASGELLWIYKQAVRHEDLMAMGKVGPRATPTIDGGKIYAQGATGLVTCLDSMGREIWTVNLTERLGIQLNRHQTSAGYTYYTEDSPLSWGRSGSPLLYKNLCIVTGGGPQGGPFTTLVALDKNTGEEVWSGGDQMIAYGSPSIANLLGQDQITLVAESKAMGFDPATGAVLWQFAREGASNANANCSQVTLVSDNRILLSKGYQLGGEMVELARNGEAIEAKSIWKNSRVLRTKMMSPVIRDGYAYSLSDGFFECSNIADDQQQGHRTFRQRDRFGNGQLLLVGDHLLIHTEHGKLKLVKANPDAYTELGEISTIAGICWNTICLYDRFLLVRSEREAACFELELSYDFATESASTASASTTSAEMDRRAEDAGKTTQAQAENAP